MKLLIYSHFFAPSIGGVETLVLSLARGLAGLRDSTGQAQFEITVATETPAGQFQDRSLPFTVVRRPGLAKLWTMIRSSDSIHVAGPAIAPILLGLLGGKLVAVEHHGFQTICPNGQLLIEPAGSPCPGHFMAGNHRTCLRCNAKEGGLVSYKLWLLTFVRRFLCRHVGTNIAPTGWLGGLLELPKMVAIPHGLEAGDVLSRDTTTAQSDPVIAFMGRLVTTKGVGVLFEAARILCNEGRTLELLIIGDGPERKTLEKLAREGSLDGRVRFAGRVAAEELNTVLAEASMVVVPSLGGEVFGLVVAENMLRGLPVISSDLGAFLEVLADAGIPFPTGDAAALARAIARILDNPDFGARLGREARQRAEQLFDFKKMIEAHARVYSER